MRIPNHVAIIPDGNRRWAKALGRPKPDGYACGLEPGVACLRLAQQYGIRELTYYGFTTDNCKRPREEVTAFTAACVDAVKQIEQDDVSLLVVGNTHSPMFPQELLPYTGARVDFGTGATKVNFLVNYGWEWDFGRFCTQSYNRHTIFDNLQSSGISRIDLVMRWGGRRRLSGLLPLQTVYADICTIEEMWPDFTSEQFERALKWYDKQDITLGG